MLGKLRVRLSCLAPNTPIAADLPLLSDRKRGAQRVGTAGLELHVSYPGGVPDLVKSYLAPGLPDAAYGAGADAGPAQAAMASETRRIVLRWLDTASPPIPTALALALLDTERSEAPLESLMKMVAAMPWEGSAGLPCRRCLPGSVHHAWPVA